MPTLAEIARYCDDLLGIPRFPDDPRALNGVQVETDADITRVACAVDARERTINAALSSGAQLLIVHHGLFWGGLQPLRGAQYRRIGAAIRGRLGVYGAHLPLDAHPEIGNNALLARELGLDPTGTFGRFGTVEIGVRGEGTPINTRELVSRARAFAERYDGSVTTSPIPEAHRTRRWAIVTGAGAGSETLAEAVERGIDTLIVGEGPHHTAISADEAGLVLVYAGHYATETLGVQALARRIAERFSVSWEFVHEPTGL
jgi:dinuclear metal center YbgI/SA1388 family protein